VRLTNRQLSEISRELDCIDRELYRLDGFSDRYSDMLREEILSKIDELEHKLEISYNLALKSEKEKRMSRFKLIQGDKK
jgi:hypothetical protein